MNSSTQQPIPFDDGVRPSRVKREIRLPAIEVAWCGKPWQEAHLSRNICAPATKSALLKPDTLGASGRRTEVFPISGRLNTPNRHRRAACGGVVHFD